MDTCKLNRIDVFDESVCCGCMACASVCPQGAILKTENSKGFIVPSIDDSKCINCGLCLKTCDFKKVHDRNSNIQKAYSLIVKDKKALHGSTSGGAFTALSDVVLGDEGYVVGAVMEKDFTVHHLITSDRSVRDSMRGSKYVQSGMDDVFPSVKDLLEKGKKVLFVGTPCQCGALRSFLGKEYNNLVVVDLLCHGVPNNKLFKDHVSFLERHYAQKITQYGFRDKKYGWDSYINVVKLSNGKSKAKWINQVYYQFFVKSVSLRPSCFNCVYRSLHRPADITIADFWGYDKILKKKNNTGVSLVFVHDEKGQALVEKCKDNSTIQEVAIEKVEKNIQTKPTSTRMNIDKFWEIYLDGGYPALFLKYFDNSFVKRMHFDVKKNIKKMMS